jgi:hypothetical protein
MMTGMTRSLMTGTNLLIPVRDMPEGSSRLGPGEPPGSYYSRLPGRLVGPRGECPDGRAKHGRRIRGFAG